MRDPAFRRAQRERLYAPHVAPINWLVDELAAEAGTWLPHVAPVHGGVNARLLWVLRDPGPAVADPDRSDAGFLCAENDDPTAQRLCELLEHGGLVPDDGVPWNAYPWYINRAPTASELRVGAAALERLLELLGQLQIVLLLGREAKQCWTFLRKRKPSGADGVLVLNARHLSRQAFIGNPEQRRQWREEQEEVFVRAGALLRGAPRP